MGGSAGLPPIVAGAYETVLEDASAEGHRHGRHVAHPASVPSGRLPASLTTQPEHDPHDRDREQCAGGVDGHVHR